MSEAIFPRTFAEAGKGVIANLTWIIPLVVLERALDGHYWQTAILVAGWIILVVMAIRWHAFEGLQRRHQMAWIVIILGALILGGGIVLLGSQSVTKGPDLSEATTTSQATASSAATPTIGALAQSTSLRLLIRPNQDPLEISRDNIWRWYVFKTMNKNPTTGETHIIGTLHFSDL